MKYRCESCNYVLGAHTIHICNAALQRFDRVTTIGKISRVSVDISFSALVGSSYDRVLVVPEPPSRPNQSRTVPRVIGIVVHVVRREGLGELVVQRIASVSSGALRGQLVF